MAAKKTNLLGPLELAVMNVIWETEDASVAEVTDALREHRDLHHNTVMTVMQRLAEKGYLRKYARDGRTNGFRPKVAREDVSKRYLDLVRDELFGGSVRGAMSALLDSSNVPPRKRRELRRLLDELGDGS